MFHCIRSDELAAELQPCVISDVAEASLQRFKNFSLKLSKVAGPASGLYYASVMLTERLRRRAFHFNGSAGTSAAAAAGGIAVPSQAVDSGAAVAEVVLLTVTRLALF
jgi:hypothetical protein